MLSAGARLGSYEVQSPLGAGGMGEVYRARDTRLNRDVALKILPEAFARDAERLARFRREAQVLASLNHSNIAAIYGFEDSGGVHALVMELVEGPTLAEKIKAGRISFDDALPIAKQICEALEYAHERGIVHRDLKPANIKIASNDSVKILDFGLAKALESDAASVDISSSPTISRMATQAGIILGTAAYMSPEQAKGKSVDRRTDIWAFGCVLYEMLTGKMAFSGETVTDTLASVIKSEVDWSALPANTPARIRELLERCLKKDARQRLQSIGDARITVEEILLGTAAQSEASQYESAGRRGMNPHASATRWGAVLPWSAAAVAIVLLIIGIGYFYFASGSAVPNSIARLDVSLPDGWSIPTRDSTILAISPDGRMIVFMSSKGAVDQLYSRSIDEREAKPIPGTENAVSPFFSPDGKWIGFFADGKLKKTSVDGGAAVTLCDATNQRGGSWAPDGTIIFSPEYATGLMRISESGGQPQPMLMPNEAKGERTYRWPDVLPDGKGVLFTIGMASSAASYDDAEIAVYSFATKTTRVLTRGDMAIYSPAGYLLYFRAGTLFAAPFSQRRMEITGQPAQLSESVGSDSTSGAVYFAIAANGTMAYLSGGAQRTSGRVVAIADAKGNAHVLPLPPGGYSIPRFSPDGKRLALTINNVDNSIAQGEGDIWVYNFGTGSLNRLTFEGNNFYALWSPDGSTVFYVSTRGRGSGSLFAKRADGTGGEQTVETGGKVVVEEDAVSPDAKTFLLTAIRGIGGDLWTLAPAQNSFRLFKTNAGGAVLSPDGNYVAYSSFQAGNYQVFVNTFPDPTKGQWQVSQENSAYPKWCKDGHELVFLSSTDRMTAVDVDLKPSLHAGAPHVLFTLSSTQFSPMQTNPAVNYDISADCQRFALLQQSGTAQASPQIAVTLNFPEEIRALAGREK